MMESVEEWVQGIPDGWELTKFKHITTKLTRPYMEDDAVVICTNKGKVVYRGSENAGLVSMTDNGYQHVEPGDLCIHGMDTWHGAIAVSDIAGKCTSVVHVCDSRENKRYLAYYLQTLAFRKVYKAFSNGVRQNTSDFRSWQKAGEIPVILPDVETQARIAKYLDTQCVEIDKAILAANNSIAEYKSYQQACTYAAVTKGLRENACIKSTGIQWIKEAPAGWAIVPQKRLMKKIKLICEHWKGEPVLSLTTGGVIVRDIASGKGKFPATFDGYQFIEAGNLVLCLFDIDVTPRCVGLAVQNGVISPAYSQFRMLDGAYAPYYDYYLRAMDDRKLYVHLTSTLRHSFTEDTFGAIPALRPPYEEQVEIADYLDQKCSEIGDVMTQKQMIIDDLNAYRQSLIYEVVTRKREV